MFEPEAVEGRRKRVHGGMSKRTKSDDEKIIHVVFGPGGGRIDSRPAAEARPNGADDDADVPRSQREPVSDVFSLGEVAKLLGMSTGKLRSLDKNDVVAPSGRRRGKRAYTFQDLIALRAARDLLKQKVRLKDVARAIGSIRVALPAVMRPLAELTIVSDGRQVVLKS